MATLSKVDVQRALRAKDTPATRAVLENSDLLAMFVGIVNGSLAALEGGSSVVFGMADKASTLADFSGKATGRRGLRVSAAVAQTLTQSLSLIKLGSEATPGRVLATVGAVFTKKVALMFGLVEDDKQAELVSAIADLTSSIIGVGLAIDVVVAGAATVPIILLLAAVAQLGASAYQTYTAYEK